MKNLLIATGIYPPDIGGPATYTRMLRSALGDVFSVQVVTYGEHSAEDGVALTRVSRGMPKGIRHCMYAWAVLRRGWHADAIFAQDTVSAGFPAVCANMILRKPFVVKVVGDHAWEQGVQRFGVRDGIDAFQKKRYGVRIELMKRLRSFVARRATRVIVPSEYLGRLVEGWGVSHERITVIYNAVAPQRDPGSRDALRKELGMKGIAIVSAGRLVPWKGFSVLLKAFAEVRSEIPDIRLFIIGDGPERTLLEDQVRDLKGAVVLCGSLPHAAVQKYLHAADIFALNTGYEGFSHQLIEAMAAGLPVVTTAVGGNGEAVRSGENGILVPYNDEQAFAQALKRLAVDPKLRERYAAEGKRAAERFSEPVMINATKKILLRVCQ
ncbi:glycosyltransferase family 4 protein [Patescibacteria group bacterium]|nr:glycosyltransferase family 4 protein [Patescibacteria group bacterium]